jgi:integrase
MYPVTTYLARRPLQTQKIYKRGLQRFADHVGVPLSKLHEYIDLPEDLKGQKAKKESLVSDILTFGDTLKNFNQNTQRLYVSCVMSYLSYNEVIIPKAQRKHAVPKPGDLFRDKAFTVEEMKRVYEFLPPIGRMALLVMFCTGMRISEAIAFKESDIEGRIIHLKAEYCKGDHGRDLVITTECQTFLNEIWLPQRQKYIDIAVTKTPKAISKAGKSQKVKSENGKSAVDDRVIPCNKSSLYAIMMLGFRKAGLDAQKDDRNLYHPHGLRKSFRSIVGSVDPDLAEFLMGHRGYLKESYIRYEDLLKKYQKVEGLLSMGSTEATSIKLRTLEEKNAELQERLNQIERVQATVKTASQEIATALSPEEKKAALASLSKDELMELLQEIAAAK